MLGMKLGDESVGGGWRELRAGERARVVAKLPSSRMMRVKQRELVGGPRERGAWLDLAWRWDEAR